jgi:hypothetical protein
MIWNGISNEERIRLWKNLRADLSKTDPEHQLSEIAKFYAAAPFGARSLDYYSPEDWPTPWEILFHGSFCVSSISLLIFYTILLIDPERIVDLYLIEDNTGIYLVPIVDNQFVLNYELGKISKFLDIKDEIKILQVFSKTQVKTIT